MQAKLEALEEILRMSTPALIAYSGGVDSTFLLAFATKRLAPEAVTAIIADSPSLPREALREALTTAQSFNAKVEVVKTTEFDDPSYLRNAPDRCLFCKSALFQLMEEIALERGCKSLMYGENADDVQYVRPGSKAAAAFKVMAPLRDVGLTKSEIRIASRALGLPTADAPAQPCLSSRIAHGLPVSREVLEKIEVAEAALRASGFREFRVRHRSWRGHEFGALCFAPPEMALAKSLSVLLLEEARRAGYRFVLMDPAGYQPPLKVAGNGTG